jgi:predicted GIY-YIG superfamily endonuclease
MKRDFDQLMADVKQLHGKLVGMTPVTRASLGDCDYPGVYLFTERGKDLYVGRTKRPLHNRILEHARPSVTDAPFAFRLTREATGKTKVTYKPGEDSRESLKNNHAFKKAFKEQCDRIGKMSIRYVRVEDATTQALLEIYTATVLDAPYNEFTTS